MKRGGKMIGKFITDRGRVRTHNEDSGGLYYNKDDQFLAVIADGMGGHRAGDVASQMATDFIGEKWRETTHFISPEAVEKWLSKVLKKANQSILKKAQKNKECQGMGTTVVISVCTDEFISIAHIGDSRCYMLSEEGFKQVTEDHSLVNELLRTGQISESDAEHHPRKNVLLKALGTEENVQADIKSLGWEKNNKLLLCSDGLANKVLNEELADYVKQDKNIQEIVQDLVELANERGGEDNVSLAIIQHKSPDQVGDDPC